jgi:hypothetical protein
MDKQSTPKHPNNKPPNRFWWLKWCFSIYVDAVIDRFRNKNGHNY